VLSAKNRKKTKTKIQFWLKTKIAKTIKNVIFDAKNQKNWLVSNIWFGMSNNGSQQVDMN